ncbi:zinc finger protein 708-like [Anopheles albimanus]|uniref:C2H2-type domain-containing protein n=1 Tax=Anopheles albimanus TaxID=7167 RepID=A0A182FPF2_ANOAL|nr:zinc finger protein 708-like [Anopheles albimanus]
MPPKVAAPIQLNSRTCRLCLNNSQELLSLEVALTQEELQNVIAKFLEIDLKENSPFCNACPSCIDEVRRIEYWREFFMGKNRMFDVLWTQHKRFQGNKKTMFFGDEIVRDKRVIADGYIIDHIVLEQNDMYIDSMDEFVKDEDDDDQCVILSEVKQEDTEPDSSLVNEELVYEEVAVEVEDIEDGTVLMADVKPQPDDIDEDSMMIEEGDEILLEGEEEGILEEHIDELQIAREDSTAEETGEDVSQNEPESEQPIEESGKIEVLEINGGLYDSALHCCYLCTQEFDDADQLNQHFQEAHQDTLPFHCDKCLSYFSSMEDVNQHLVTHVYPYVCLYCRQQYSHEVLLVEHNKTCHAYRCPHCSAEFEIMAQLNAHKKEHAAILRQSNRCKTCGRTFTQQGNLLRHVRLRSCVKPAPKMVKTGNQKATEVHALRPKKRPLPADDASENSEEVRSRNLVVCQVCSHRFESNSNLARHIDREHAEFKIPLYNCDVCPKKFTVFEKCVRHRAFHRHSKPKEKPAKKEDSDRNCKLCGKEFRIEFQLLRHLAEEHMLALQLFECDQCDRKFSTETKLRKHLYNSHRENKTLYVCSHCGQKFEKKLTLKDHETKHLGEPAYRCEICTKTFIHKHSLDRHALVHSDAKLFECEFCLKRFKRNTTLVIHRRIHTGEKPYSCDACDLRFIDSSTLIKHRQRAHSKAE